MEDRIQIAQSFLSWFDDPVRKLLKINWVEWPKRINNFYSLPDAIALNTEYPSGLYFMPNGRFWLTNTIGSNIKYDKASLPSQTYVSAFVFDWDLKMYPDFTKKDLLDHIHKNFNKLWYRPKFIVDSGWGFHAYLIIERWCRVEAYKRYWEWLLKISSTLASKLWADMSARVSSSLSALIRLPGSFNWKYEEKTEVKIIEETQELVTLDQIDKSMKYINQLEENQKTISSLKTQFSVGWLYDDASKIPMPELLKKLEKYPRLIQGRAQVLKIEWDQVIIIREDGEILRWNSYKYNKGENYIHCFFEGDMELAPEGNWYWFLYWYFRKDRVKISKFLSEEFWITADNNLVTMGTLQKEYQTYGATVKVYDLGVTLDITKTSPKGTSITETKTLFRSPLKFLAKGTVTNTAMWEWDPERVFIIDVDWRPDIMKIFPTKKDHNKKNASSMFFYGTDNDLWLLYSALDSAHDLPEIEVLERSWYYGERCVLSNQLMLWELYNDKIINKFIFKTLKEEKRKITAKEFFAMFRKLYKDNIAIPAVLQAIALGGMNLWENFNTYPALLISGRTWSGKSAMVNMLKSMLWYWQNARTMSLPGITPQPLKEAASDYSILFLEELTQKVGETTEELLRNIVNRDKASRGSLDTNVDFNLRSPLFVVGERTFKDESLNNRFVCVVSNRNSWKPNAKNLVNELMNYTAWEDIYSTFIKHRDVISKKAKDYSTQLSKAWFDARHADTYSFMFVINEIFNFWITEKELMDLVRESLWRTWALENAEESARETLRVAIVRLLSTKSWSMTIRDTEWTPPKLNFNITILNDAEYQKTRAIINNAMMEINEELGWWYCRSSSTTITFSVPFVRSEWKLVDMPSKKICEMMTLVLESAPSRGFDSVTNLSWRYP